MSLNQFSRAVTPVDQYLPISDELLTRGAVETYNKAGQLGQKLSAYKSNLFGISTYGKDAEVLQDYENQFNQQVAELSKGDITSPQALSKFNSLVSNFSNSPDVLAIHKRKSKFDEWNKQLQDYQEKGKFVPAWKMKQYNDAQDYYSGDKYYTDKQFTGNLTPGFDWDKHNKDLISSTPEIEQLKKSGVNNDLYKGKTYNALQGKFYEGLNQPGALDDLRQHFEYDYGNEDYATHDQQNAIEQVNKLNSIIQTSNDPILINQAKADLDYWDDFATTVNPQTSKEDAFQRYIRSNAEDFARTNTNYALKESKMSDANKMYTEHSLRQQEDLYKLQLKTGLTPNKGESQSAYIARLAKAAQDKDLEIAQAKAKIQTDAEAEREANKQINRVELQKFKNATKGTKEYSSNVAERVIKGLGDGTLDSDKDATALKGMILANKNKLFNPENGKTLIDPNIMSVTINPDTQDVTVKYDTGIGNSHEYTYKYNDVLDVINDTPTYTPNSSSSVKEQPSGEMQYSKDVDGKEIYSEDQGKTWKYKQ